MYKYMLQMFNCTGKGPRQRIGMKTEKIQNCVALPNTQNLWRQKYQKSKISPSTTHVRKTYFLCKYLSFAEEWKTDTQ